MVTPINTINWQPYQGGASGSLIATVALDSAIDTRWTVPIVGQFQNTTRYADGVIVYNSQNNGTVFITAGALITVIDPFSRDYVLLEKSVVGNIDVTITTGSIALLFYIGKPPVNPSILNYAGAAAVANSVVFPGGVTTGSANAQAISVSTLYQFSNGVIISCTAGFDNTSAVTLNVNGMGAVPVRKNSAFAGGMPMIGREFQAGTNFMVSVNETQGCFDLISDVASNSGANFWVPTDDSGAGVITLANGRWQQIGNEIRCEFIVTYAVNADPSAVLIGGLPIVVSNVNYNTYPALVRSVTANPAAMSVPLATTQQFGLVSVVTGASILNSNVSGLTLRGSVTYLLV